MTNAKAIFKLKSVCNKCKEFPKCVYTDSECFNAIEMAISALEKQTNTAEWKAYYKEKDHRYSDLLWYCSNCGERFVIDGKDEMESFKYCPNCGIRMKGENQ